MRAPSPAARLVNEILSGPSMRPLPADVERALDQLRLGATAPRA